MLRDKVIVIKTYKHAESNLIVHVLNAQGIKLKLIAPSALVSKKRFGGGVLQPTHYIQICYKPSRDQEGLGTLLEASIIDDFSELREDYDRLQMALYFLGLVDKVSQEGESFSHALFDLLGNALRAASNSQCLNVLKTHFEIKLLYSQGVMGADNKILRFFNTPISRHSELAGDENLSFAQTTSRINLNHYIGTL
jgi:DNA repair protein RecO (recombination protein O)